MIWAPAADNISSKHHFFDRRTRAGVEAAACVYNAEADSVANACDDDDGDEGPRQVGCCCPDVGCRPLLEA